MQIGNLQIDICVATYKRPSLLKQLLVSLMQLELTENLSVRIVVVDNDAAGSARDTVNSFAGKSIPIIYDIEPTQNIALARNRCVANSTADFIAFVDDDEFVDKSWLLNLVGTLHQYNADAVFGPVIPIFPEDAPAWIQRGGFFDRPRFPTGEKLEVGRTGNALVKGTWMRKWAGPFDKEYGLTGGEDSDFFKRVRQAGGILIWCDMATLYEAVPADRLTVQYLATRAFTGGQIYAASELPHFGLVSFWMWFLRRIGLVAIALLWMILIWPIGLQLGVKALQKVCSNLGQLSILIKYRYKQYASR